MNTRWLRWVWSAAILIGSGWLFVGASALFTQGAPGYEPAPTLVADFAGFSGTSSCSGRACHGGISPAGSKDCEYTTWMLSGDPHAKAFAVLANDRSRAMVKNLRQLKTLEEARPQADALCLSCHGPAMLAAGPKAGADDGFGCESCHGASKKWLGPHTAAAEWAKVGIAEKRKLGFKPMDTWADRAKVCTECHVGSGDREVNHDLLAAGHPRLNFEFDTYYANLPRHWQPERDKDRASAWEIGQTASAVAALELLAFRADPKHDRPWPEFAEYDCFACHHDLKAKSERQKLGYGDRVPGTLPWNDWYYVRILPWLQPDQSAPPLQLLSREMSRPYPEREKVARLAREEAARFQRPGKSWPHQSPPSGDLLTVLKQGWPFGMEGKEPTLRNWDIAARLALALQSEYANRVAADPKKSDPETEKALAELFRLLQFSKTGTFDSPVAFDGKAVVKQVEVVCKRLGG